MEYQFDRQCARLGVLIFLTAVFEDFMNRGDGPQLLWEKTIQYIMDGHSPVESAARAKMDWLQVTVDLIADRGPEAIIDAYDARRAACQCPECAAARQRN